MRIRDCEDYIFLRGEVMRLWSLLDDIDTAGDMFKPEINSYFRYVNDKAQERFNHIISDGYTLFREK